MSNEIAVREPQVSVLEFRSFDQLQQIAEYLSKSGLIPASLKGKPADVALVLAQGQELGIGPMQSLNGIEPIQGKPTIKPELAIALIRSRVPGAIIRFEELAEDKVTVFMARSKAQEDEGYRATWDMAKATRLGLSSKDNYKKQPGTMLKWRACGECARTIFPDVLKGLKFTQELEEEKDPPRDIESEVVVGKAAELQEKLKQGAVLEDARQVTHQPEVAGGVSPGPDSTSDPVGNPLLEYVLPVGPHKGKRIADVEPATLQDQAAIIRKTAAERGAELSGNLLEMVTRIDQYLEQLADQF